MRLLDGSARPLVLPDEVMLSDLYSRLKEIHSKGYNLEAPDHDHGIGQGGAGTYVPSFGDGSTSGTCAGCTHPRNLTSRLPSWPSGMRKTPLLNNRRTNQTTRVVLLGSRPRELETWPRHVAGCPFDHWERHSILLAGESVDVHGTLWPELLNRDRLMFGRPLGELFGGVDSLEINPVVHALNL